MFAFMCLTVPLAMVPYDAEGLPMPIGVTARYGSPRHLMPNTEYRMRFLPDDKTAISLVVNSLSMWNLETGLRIREVVEADWEFKDYRLSNDGSKISATGEGAGIGPPPGCGGIEGGCLFAFRRG